MATCIGQCRRGYIGARRRSAVAFPCLTTAIIRFQAAAFATISPEATGRASTMFNVGRQLGSAIGVAVFTTVVVAVGATKVVADQVTPNPGHLPPAFEVAAWLALAGAVVALTIRDADAISTMVRWGGRRAEPAAAPSPPPVGRRSPGQADIRASTRCSPGATSPVGVTTDLTGQAAAYHSVRAASGQAPLTRMGKGRTEAHR